MNRYEVKLREACMNTATALTVFTLKEKTGNRNISYKDTEDTFIRFYKRMYKCNNVGELY